VSDDGRVVVWEDELGKTADGYPVKVAVRSVAGGFGAPVVVGRSDGDEAVGAIGADGRVVVAWPDEFGTAVDAVERAPGQAAFGAPRTLFRRASDDSRGVGTVAVAVGARGGAIVAWQQHMRGGRDRIAAVDWPAGSRPGGPHFVAAAAPGAFQSDPRVVNGPHGLLVLFATDSARRSPDDARAWVAAPPGARPAPLAVAGHRSGPIFAAGPAGVTALWLVEAPDRARFSDLG
jgi:hypothetical protein